MAPGPAGFAARRAVDEDKSFVRRERGHEGQVPGRGRRGLSGLILVASLVSVSGAGPNVLRIHVIEHATTETVVDLTANGDSTGDLSTFDNEIFHGDDQTVIGTSDVDCVRIDVGVSWECRWVTTLEVGS